VSTETVKMCKLFAPNCNQITTSSRPTLVCSPDALPAAKATVLIAPNAQFAFPQLN